MNEVVHDTYYPKGGWIQASLRTGLLLKHFNTNWKRILPENQVVFLSGLHGWMEYFAGESAIAIEYYYA